MGMPVSSFIRSLILHPHISYLHSCTLAVPTHPLHYIVALDSGSEAGNLHDLEASILKAELAVSTTPEDHPNRAAFLNNLGIRLSDRYYRTENMHDLMAALKSLIMSFNLPNALALTRMRAARRAIRILVSAENWDQASSLAQEPIYLI